MASRLSNSQRIISNLSNRFTSMDFFVQKYGNQTKQQNIYIVPGSAFGCPGYVRIAYCVAYKTIERALLGFKTLIEDCN